LPKLPRGSGRHAERHPEAGGADTAGVHRSAELTTARPTREPKVADPNADGRPDPVGKPYHPERHVDVRWNETGD
jgi:hypothetical protein